MSRPHKLQAGEVHEPLRIVVVGGSVSLLVIPHRTVRSEGNYGEVLVRLLADEGIAATVEHQGKWFDMIHELRRRYEFAIRNRFPDVVIFNYGMGEAQPHTLPTWLARHFTSWDRSSHPVAAGYRRRVAPGLWRLARRWQQSSARHDRLATWRLSPARFATELDHVISMTRSETGALVLVVDCDPPGERFWYWLPGLQQRWEIFQRTLSELVARIGDPQVRLVPASTTIDDIEAELPDGIHRTATSHRKTAELLCREIVSWLNAPVAVETAARS